MLTPISTRMMWHMTMTLVLSFNLNSQIQALLLKYCKRTHQAMDPCLWSPMWVLPVVSSNWLRPIPKCERLHLSFLAHFLFFLILRFFYTTTTQLLTDCTTFNFLCYYYFIFWSNKFDFENDYCWFASNQQMSSLDYCFKKEIVLLKEKLPLNYCWLCLPQISKCVLFIAFLN